MCNYTDLELGCLVCQEEQCWHRHVYPLSDPRTTFWMMSYDTTTQVHVSLENQAVYFCKDKATICIYGIILWICIHPLYVQLVVFLYDRFQFSFVFLILCIWEKVLLLFLCGIYTVVVLESTGILGLLNSSALFILAVFFFITLEISACLNREKFDLRKCGNDMTMMWQWCKLCEGLK